MVVPTRLEGFPHWLGGGGTVKCSAIVSVLHSNLLRALLLILGAGDLHTLSGDDRSDRFSAARFLQSNQSGTL